VAIAVVTGLVPVTPLRGAVRFGVMDAVPC
jgi:hypothetical protein